MDQTWAVLGDNPTRRTWTLLRLCLVLFQCCYLAVGAPFPPGQSQFNIPVQGRHINHFNKSPCAFGHLVNLKRYREDQHGPCTKDDTLNQREATSFSYVFRTICLLCTNWSVSFLCVYITVEQLLSQARRIPLGRFREHLAPRGSPSALNNTTTTTTTTCPFQF